MLIKRFFLLLILLVPIFSFGQNLIFRGTTVIAYATKDTIWIAADSKANGQNGQIAHTLKISASNSFIAGIAGLANYLVGGNLLNFALKDFENSASKCKNSRCLISSYINAYESDLQFLNQQNKIRDRDTSSILFGYFDNTMPVLIMITFYSKKQNGKLSIDTLIDSTSNANNGLAIGYHDEIQNFISSHPDFLSKGNIRLKLQELIEKEIHAHGDVVGKPIDIIELSRDGKVVKLMHNYSQ